MGELRRITFHFGIELEVRYLSEVPAAGDLVTHQRALWVVSRVTDDTVGIAVICELPRSNGDHVETAAA